jgi:long-chain acyl-CoA synthetase
LQPSFRWHPAARLMNVAQTREVVRYRPVIPEQPAWRALTSALAGQGRPFRIGGTGPAPEPGSEPVFETLTGGSTGTPRRIRRTQRSWTASFAVNAGLFGIGPGSQSAVLGDLVHSLALYGALESLHLGASLHLLSGQRPGQQRAALAADPVDLIYATPTQLRLLAEAKGPVLPARHILVGGSKLDPALRRVLTEMAPQATIHEFYGAAEASFITLAGPDAPDASVGRPYPGVQIETRGAEGDIWVQSPYLFEAYAGEPGSARWQDGWLWLGEHGRIENGFLHLSGRATRMVKIADRAAYPEEIETFLLSQPGVTSAAVLPRPDPLRGHHLVALVQGEAPDDALLAALRVAFGPLIAPKAILRPADWPMLASGKTDLAALARLT